MVTLLGPGELERIEREHAAGISARAVVEIFKPLGVKLSEATFRKYVQVGLLPRSRRVGRKGKHRGSRGLYPVSVVRRINLIKTMMAEGLTLEQIRGSFVVFRNDIEELERTLEALVARQLESLAERDLPRDMRRDLERELSDSRREGQLLVRRLEQLASRMVAGAFPKTPAGEAQPGEAGRLYG